ncbi:MULTISPECIES: hypothetical protein [Pseudomonas]|uniref:hypothetical protein n=1 Tax=Pseudomonas TaxID=286 RepID=UPI002DBE1B77|nr:hypothetical protein [Pseudomonas asiatica]MEB6587984.1 hypothetical protein [Pseudomonas asiatica]
MPIQPVLEDQTYGDWQRAPRDLHEGIFGVPGCAQRSLQSTLQGMATFSELARRHSL